MGKTPITVAPSATIGDPDPRSTSSRRDLSLSLVLTRQASLSSYWASARGNAPGHWFPEVLTKKIGHRGQ
jgi:hypothetical protein